jgi:hypothetical protein
MLIKIAFQMKLVFYEGSEVGGALQLPSDLDSTRKGAVVILFFSDLGMILLEHVNFISCNLESNRVHHRNSIEIRPDYSKTIKKK